MTSTHDPPSPGGFAQTPTSILRWSSLPIGARLLMGLLKSYARADGYTDVTLETLARDMGKGGSVRNLKRWMTLLEKHELIHRERRRRPQGETWEATRTWLLVDVINGRVMRREPGSSHGSPMSYGPEPGAAHGPWIGQSPGQSQGPPMAHNVDALHASTTYKEETPPGSPSSTGREGSEVIALPIQVAQASRPTGGHLCVRCGAEAMPSCPAPEPLCVEHTLEWRDGKWKL